MKLFSCGDNERGHTCLHTLPESGRAAMPVAAHSGRAPSPWPLSEEELGLSQGIAALQPMLLQLLRDTEQGRGCKPPKITPARRRLPPAAGAPAGQLREHGRPGRARSSPCQAKRMG